MSNKPVEYPIDKNSSINVMNFYLEYRNYVERNESDGTRYREIRNYRAYSGVNHGQWDKESLQILKDSGRPAHQFNFIQTTIDAVQGNLAQEPIDVKFVPHGENPEMGEKSNDIQDMYEYDYNLNNWENEKEKAKRDSLIFKGVLQMYVDYGCNPLGNIAIRALNPNYIQLDPYWQTDDIRDCRGIFRENWMTADQIKKMYRTKSQEVNDAIRQYQFQTEQSSNSNVNNYYGGMYQDRSPEYYDQDGGRFKVIEFTWMEMQQKRKVINSEDLTYDESIEDDDSIDEVFEAKAKLKNPNNRVKYEKKQVCRVFTFAPGLSMHLVLAQGDYPIQIGQLPYSIKSYKNLYGERQGMVDLFYDANMILNKRQSNISSIIGTIGNNNWQVEKGAFDDQAGLNDFKRRASATGQVFEVEDGTNREDKIKPVDRAQIPQEIFQTSNDMMEMLRSLSSMVPGQQSGKSGESGDLFNSKVNQQLVAMESLADTYNAWDKEIAEMYFKAIQDWYTEPRKFEMKGGKVIWINVPGIDANGQYEKAKSIKDMTRYDVEVVKRKMGNGRRQELLSRYAEVSRYIQNPMIRSGMEIQLIEYMNLPEKEKQAIKEAGLVYLQNQMKQLENQTVQSDAQTQQLVAQTQQANDPSQALGQMQEGQKQISQGQPQP